MPTTVIDVASSSPPLRRLPCIFSEWPLSPMTMHYGPIEAAVCPCLSLQLGSSH